MSDASNSSLNPYILVHFVWHEQSPKVSLKFLGLYIAIKCGATTTRLLKMTITDKEYCNFKEVIFYLDNIYISLLQILL
jgi:hypothetical protein